MSIKFRSVPSLVNGFRSRFFYAVMFVILLNGWLLYELFSPGGHFHSARQLHHSTDIQPAYAYDAPDRPEAVQVHLEWVKVEERYDESFLIEIYREVETYLDADGTRIESVPTSNTKSLRYYIGDQPVTVPDHSIHAEPHSTPDIHIK
ncbi:hypothetical protein [Marinicrinis sediminis]|uniref:Uncharacterized protein n=1 Tax=Marinicrinis sediminis TaxID=1652465 RepID=A0ABW5RCL9_9BACL